MTCNFQLSISQKSAVLKRAISAELRLQQTCKEINSLLVCYS
jgi:hypothetical protein